MVDLRQVVFSQTGHFYDGIVVDALLFKLFDGHKCISVLRHTLCQFASKT